MELGGRLPDRASQEYLWWQAGAQDEAKARDENLSQGAREVRDVTEALARAHPGQSRAALALALARIFCPEKLKRRHRL